jgi:hypothetical protein
MFFIRYITHQNIRASDIFCSTFVIHIIILVKMDNCTQSLVAAFGIIHSSRIPRQNNITGNIIYFIKYDIFSFYHKENKI